MAPQICLIQGSPEWHAHRAKYRNASETAAVMGVNPWQTPLQLWEIRTGRSQPVINAAMARGTQLEPLAREAYEKLTGVIMQPVVLVEGEYSASLDGMTFDGGLALEIKCPAKGRASTLWQAVAAGQVPEHYRWQIEHQLMVSGATAAHLFVFDGDTGDGKLLEVAPQPGEWERIHAAWDAFAELIRSDTPPALSDRDKRQRTDPEWMVATEQYLAAKRRADAVSAELEEAKASLLKLASHSSECGNGVTVTKFWKQGSVDYKKVPELKGLNLDAFRGKGRFETRITSK